jgi:hypothetical protein
MEDMPAREGGWRKEVVVFMIASICKLAQAALEIQTEQIENTV